MANIEGKPTGSGKEIALLVGVLMLVVAGTIGTYWVRTQGAEASGKTAAATPTETSRPRVSAPAPTATDGEVVHADVYFDFKSTRLRADAARMLQDKAALMERTSTWAVLVQGYADRQGPAEYNKRLAQQRAEAVRQFLVELGVPEGTVKTVTIGQDGALCDEPSKECQQLNRRVHLEIRRLARITAPVRPAALRIGEAQQP
ncbi:MAG TPA: OmpA family protein [Methylomirabilota bacterium]|jgi:outer membrane protein OmpA-like peptidoglycan-associated protein